MVAPRAFIAGEESAVVAAVEGGPARPRDKRRLIVEAGVRGAPTLVQNVETLAHIALIARHGPAWFRGQGTPDEPGTFLATVGGAVATPGVYEVPYGVSLGALLRGGRRPGRPLQAVLVGGYHGAWVPPDPELPVIPGRAAPRTAPRPGAGVLLALPARACGLVESARIARLPGRAERRPVRAVPQRPAPPGRHAGPAGRRAVRRPGLPAEVRPADRAGDRARRLPPPGRHGPVRPQHAARVRGRGRAAPVRPVPGPG